VQEQRPQWQGQSPGAGASQASQGQSWTPSAYATPSPPTTNSKADAAFVLGIISIFLNVLYVPGILAIVWGGRERHENPKARTGFICGIIGTALSLMVTLFFVVAIASAGNAVNNLPSSPSPSSPAVTSPAPSSQAPNGPAPTTPAKPAGGHGFGSAACTQAMAEQQRALGNLSTHLSDPAATQRLADANAAQLEAC